MEQHKKIQIPCKKALKEAKALQQSIKQLKNELHQWLDGANSHWILEKIPAKTSQLPAPGDHSAEAEKNEPKSIKDLRDDLENFMQNIAEFFETLSIGNNCQELLDCYFDMVYVVIPVEVTADISMVKIGKYLKAIRRFGRKLKTYIDSMENQLLMERRPFDDADLGRYSMKTIPNTTEDRLDEYLARQDADNECQRTKLGKKKISNYDLSTKNYEEELTLEEQAWAKISNQAGNIKRLAMGPDQLKELRKKVEDQLRFKSYKAERLSWKSSEQSMSFQKKTFQKVMATDDDKPTSTRKSTFNAQISRVKEI